MLSAHKEVIPRLRGTTDVQMCLLVMTVAIGLHHPVDPTDGYEYIAYVAVRY